MNPTPPKYIPPNNHRLSKDGNIDLKKASIMDPNSIDHKDASITTQPQPVTSVAGAPVTATYVRDTKIVNKESPRNVSKQKHARTPASPFARESLKTNTNRSNANNINSMLGNPSPKDEVNSSRNNNEIVNMKCEIQQPRAISASR